MSHPKCPSCAKYFSTLAGLQAHQKAKKHSLPPPAAVPAFFCDLACGKTFSSKALRDEHVSTAHPACEHCYRPFLSNDALKTHIAFAHSQCSCNICLRTANPELYCDVCSHQFTSLGQLQDHYLESSNHNQCTICTIGFPDVDRLEKVCDFLYHFPINHRCLNDFSIYLTCILILSLLQPPHRRV